MRRRESLTLTMGDGAGEGEGELVGVVDEALLVDDVDDVDDTDALVFVPTIATHFLS